MFLKFTGYGWYLSPLTYRTHPLIGPGTIIDSTDAIVKHWFK